MKGHVRNSGLCVALPLPFSSLLTAATTRTAWTHCIKGVSRACYETADGTALVFQRSSTSLKPSVPVQPFSVQRRPRTADRHPSRPRGRMPTAAATQDSKERQQHGRDVHQCDAEVRHQAGAQHRRDVRYRAGVKQSGDIGGCQHAAEVRRGRTQHCA